MQEDLFSGAEPQDDPYYHSAAPLVPRTDDLDAVALASKGCRACHLWRLGTQTVFGEGPQSARVVFVGEQPGDKEDLAGRPFVGPAGQVFERALEEAGISRADAYVTNAVKHFKWIPQAGRRLHQKPNRKEQIACRPWLEAELALVRPEVLVLLGATAAQSLLGSDFKITKNRGRFLESNLAPRVIATLHPSAVLRQPDEDARAEAYAGLVADLRMAAGVLSERKGYVA